MKIGHAALAILPRHYLLTARSSIFGTVNRQEVNGA